MGFDVRPMFTSKIRDFFYPECLLLFRQLFLSIYSVLGAGVKNSTSSLRPYRLLERKDIKQSQKYLITDRDKWFTVISGGGSMNWCNHFGKQQSDAF